MIQAKPRTIHAVLLGAMMMTLVGCEKTRLDQQVKELCAKDGGVKVYETVTLPPERFDEFGNVRIPSEQNATVADEYFRRMSTTYYRRGNPEMSRTIHQIVRRSDGKALGEAITYARGGGDLPGPWHESSFICPNPTTGIGLEATIFAKGEKK